MKKTLVNFILIAILIFANTDISNAFWPWSKSKVEDLGHTNKCECSSDQKKDVCYLKIYKNMKEDWNEYKKASKKYRKSEKKEVKLEEYMNTNQYKAMIMYQENEYGHTIDCGCDFSIKGVADCYLKFYNAMIQDPKKIDEFAEKLRGKSPDQFSKYIKDNNEYKAYSMIKDSLDEEKLSNPQVGKITYQIPISLQNKYITVVNVPELTKNYTIISTNGFDLKKGILINVESKTILDAENNIAYEYDDSGKLAKDFDVYIRKEHGLKAMLSFYNVIGDVDGKKGALQITKKVDISNISINSNVNEPKFSSARCKHCDAKMVVIETNQCGECGKYQNEKVQSIEDKCKDCGEILDDGYCWNGCQDINTETYCGACDSYFIMGSDFACTNCGYRP